MTILGLDPPQHSYLAFWQPPISELPCIDLHLLLVEVPNLNDPKLGKQGIQMVEPPLANYQVDMPLLQSKGGPLKVPSTA